MAGAGPNIRYIGYKIPEKFRSIGVTRIRIGLRMEIPTSRFYASRSWELGWRFALLWDKLNS